MPASTRGRLQINEAFISGLRHLAGRFQFYWGSRGDSQKSFPLDGISQTLPLIIPSINKKLRIMQPIELLAPNDQLIPGVAKSGKGRSLTNQDSLRIKAAEYWLKLAEADQALKELEGLPSRSWKCGWALKTRIAAMGALRGRDEITAQA
jgi:hypothetical protein